MKMVQPSVQSSLRSLVTQDNQILGLTRLVKKTADNHKNQHGDENEEGKEEIIEEKKENRGKTQGTKRKYNG